jgi:hypothetical protein
MADNSAPTESRLSIQASREGYSQDGDFGDPAGATQTIEPAQPLSRVALGLLAMVAWSLTATWFAFLVWLAFKALSLL